MGDIKLVAPVKLFCGLIYSDEEAASKAKQMLVENFGPLDAETGVMPFTFTDYYEQEMGKGLFRRFVSFERLVDPSELVDIKLKTDELEKCLLAPGDTKRRVNLDPGFLDASKLVLASTKSSGHRIYLGRGIYAEMTIRFARKGCTFFEWTYPDFKSPGYTEFFLSVRAMYLKTAHASSATGDYKLHLCVVEPAKSH